MKIAITAFCTLLLLLACAQGRVLHVASSGADSPGSGSTGNYYGDLQHALDQAQDGDTLLIAEGTYAAQPVPFIEELCGNAAQHRTPVKASRGFLIAGKGLTIIGAGPDKTALLTNAGYGVLCLHSPEAVIKNLTITGGKRDADGNATDAGIVVKFSRVTIQNVHIRDNVDRIDSVVVGIGGIFGRENSELILLDNQINNNGWDGIALYRGATAYIADNVIREGRGAGIGITWDATAIVLRNQISGYWKGIGTFGASRAVVSNNLVQNCLGWGLIATGDSYLEAVNNNLIHNGNCGLAIWSETCRGRLLNNLVIYNGWKEEWVAPQVGLWNNGKLDNFIIAHNDIWGNVKANYENMPDLTGTDGNISADPLLMDGQDFHLQEGSPCRDTGSFLVSEGDGSPSDMGMYGGPGAR